MAHSTSMDDMMRMSFDDLRSSVHIRPSITGRMPRSLPAATAIAADALPVVPDTKSGLQVFFYGEGAAKHAVPGTGVKTLEKERVSMVCKDKNDFILFEPLANAVQTNKRIVITAPLGGSEALRSAQAYYATSLAQWLSEEKVDGAGRPYGQTRDEEPTLRKKFSRKQILAILRFGGCDGAAR